MIEIKKSNAKLWSRLGSRATFGMAINELAKEKLNFFVMSADLCSSSGLAQFAKNYPDRFINMGISEQNMVGAAAGFADDGTPVFASSFSPFIAMRASEQVRLNMGYMQKNVKTVGLGSGLVLAQLGNSHFGLEDVAVMRSIPNMTIVNPADCTEVVKAVEAIEAYEGPVYLRLTGGPGNPVVYSEDYEFKIGKAICLQEGSDVAIIASGTMVHQSLEAANILAEKGISSTIIDMHTIKPLDTACIESLLSHRLIVTIEEHSVVGGLGSAVAESLSCKENAPRHLILGINDFFPKAGTYEYLLEQCGLTAKAISTRISTFIGA